MWALAHGALDWGEGSEMEGEHTDAHCFPRLGGHTRLLSPLRGSAGALRLKSARPGGAGGSVPPRACGSGVPGSGSEVALLAWQGVPPGKVGPPLLAVGKASRASPSGPNTQRDVSE